MSSHPAQQRKAMNLRNATEHDIDGITAIYNHAVEHSTAIWNTHTVDTANRRAWHAARVEAGYPVLVAIDDDGGVAGYATFGDWRAWDGYRHTVEHSVYVRSDQQGQGIGRHLLNALIERARQIGKHVMIAGIEANNLASIRLHEQLGFQTVGHMKEVGVKFGAWLDLTFLQLQLDTRKADDV